MEKLAFDTCNQNITLICVGYNGKWTGIYIDMVAIWNTSLTEKCIVSFCQIDNLIFNFCLFLYTKGIWVSTHTNEGQDSGQL